MADETESLALRLLREIRAENQAFVAGERAFVEEQRAANAKLEGKLDIELIGVKGRVRKVEEALESIARVMSDGALG